MNAVKAISTSGGRVAYALVFLDRLQNGVRRLREAGVTAYSVIKIDGFLRILSEDRLRVGLRQDNEIFGGFSKCGGIET